MPDQNGEVIPDGVIVPASIEAAPNDGAISRPRCGIVMPISASGDYTEKHWQDVLEILKDAVNDEFDADLVSSSDEVTIIHKNIVQNLGTNPVVICDVSDRNPNVMFELGLRLCFDLSTVVVKDTVTPTRSTPRR